MVALNQDSLGHRGAIVYQSDPYNRTITTFVKKLADRKSPRAAALFNRGATSAKVTLTREQMGFDATAPCKTVSLRDVDAQKDVASGITASALIAVTLQPHEVRVLRASCA